MFVLWVIYPRICSASDISCSLLCSPVWLISQMGKPRAKAYKPRPREVKTWNLGTISITLPVEMSSDLSKLPTDRKTLPSQAVGGQLSITWHGLVIFSRHTCGPSPWSSPCCSFFSTTSPPAISLYFPFSNMCDLSVWGCERLITLVWTRLTVGRPWENFSHTLEPAGLKTERLIPVILSSSGPPWSHGPHCEKLNRRFERKAHGTATQHVKSAGSGCLCLHSKTTVKPEPRWTHTKLTL